MRGFSTRTVTIGTAVGAALFGVLAFGGNSASADEFPIGPFGGVILDRTPGEVVLLDERAVPEAFVGQACTATETVVNNESVHPNNDLLLTTAGVQYVLEDVESEAGSVSTGQGVVVLGETVRIELRFGDDGITSGGFVVVFDCVEQPVTTPPDEGTTPPDEGTTPPDEGTTPPDEGTTPPDEGTTPPDEGTTPPDEGTTPPESTVPDTTVPPTSSPAPPVEADPDFTG